MPAPLVPTSTEVRDIRQLAEKIGVQGLRARIRQIASRSMHSPDPETREIARTILETLARNGGPR